MVCLAVPVRKVMVCATALYLQKSLTEIHLSVNQIYTVAAAWRKGLFSLVNFSCTGHSWLCFVAMPAVSCCMYTLKWRLPHCMSLLWNAFEYANKHTLGILLMSTKINCTQCRESGTQVPRVRTGICSSPVTPMLCKDHSPAICRRAEFMKDLTTTWGLGGSTFTSTMFKLNCKISDFFLFCLPLSVYKGYCTRSDFSLWQFHIIVTPMK